MKYILAIIIILFIFLYCLGCATVNVNKEINIFVIEPVVELEVEK